MKQNDIKPLLETLRYPVLYETGGGKEYISSNIHSYTGIYVEEFSANRDLFPGKINPEDYVESNHRIKEWHKHNEPGVLVTEFRFKTAFGEYIRFEDYIASVKKEGYKKFMMGLMVDVTDEKTESIHILQQLFTEKVSDEFKIRSFRKRLTDLDEQKRKRKSAADKLVEIIMGEQMEMKNIFTLFYPKQQ